MRNLWAIVALIVGGLPTMAAGQVTTQSTALERLKSSTSETLAIASELTAQKRAEAEKRFEKELETIETKLDELKAKAKDAGAEATARAASYLPDLEMRKRELENKIEDLKTRSGYAWDDLATGTDKALRELKHGYEKAKSRFD